MILDSFRSLKHLCECGTVNCHEGMSSGEKRYCLCVLSC